MKSTPLLLATASVCFLSACGSVYRTDSPYGKARAAVARPSAAPSAALLAPRGGLILASAPAGATVSIGELGTTVTPVNLQGLAPGSYLIKLSLADHLPEERRIEVVAGQTFDLGVIALRPVPIAPPVTVVSPPVTAPSLEPGIRAVRTGANVLLTWTLPLATDGYRGIEIMRNDRDTPSGRNRVRAVRASVTELEDTLPDPGARYWYWIKLTATDGAISNLGPTEAVNTP